MIPVPGRYGPPPVPPPEPGPMPAPSPSPIPVPWPRPGAAAGAGPVAVGFLRRRLRAAIHGTPARSRGSAATGTTGATTGGGSALTGGGSTGFDDRRRLDARRRAPDRDRAPHLLDALAFRGRRRRRFACGRRHRRRRPVPGATRNTSRISFFSSGVTSACGLRHPQRRQQHEPGGHAPACSVPDERERQSRLAPHAAARPEQRPLDRGRLTLRASGPRAPRPPA